MKQIVCDICKQDVVRRVFCHRPALMCPNCMAKYDSKTGKQDKRFKPLHKEFWLPHLRELVPETPKG